jgi:hypothetical protein
MNDGKFELVILKNLDLLVISKIITGNMPINLDDIFKLFQQIRTIKTNNLLVFKLMENTVVKKCLR